MANENYDELVKQARRLHEEAYDNAPIALVNELRNAVEQLLNDREAYIVRKWKSRQQQIEKELKSQLARAEQRIADLQKNLVRHKGCSVDQVSVSSARVEAVAKEKK